MCNRVVRSGGRIAWGDSVEDGVVNRFLDHLVVRGSLRRGSLTTRSIWRNSSDSLLIVVSLLSWCGRLICSTISIGCGSGGGSSRNSGDGAVDVAGLVDASTFLCDVERPVGIEATVEAHGPQLEHGFGPVDGPTGACDVHPVSHEESAGSFDDAGGDGPASCQRDRVVKVGGLVGQVVGAGVGLAPVGLAQRERGPAAPNAGGELTGVAVENGQGRFCSHASAARSPSAKKYRTAPHGVLHDADQVDDDGDAHRALLGLGLYAVDMVGSASTTVTQRRSWSGSRRSASSRTQVITSAASSTIAVSHLPVAFGARGGASGWRRERRRGRGERV